MSRAAVTVNRECGTESPIGGGELLKARQLALLLLLPRCEYQRLDLNSRNQFPLPPEGVSLFERRPPHFSTGVYSFVDCQQDEISKCETANAARHRVALESSRRAVRNK